MVLEALACGTPVVTTARHGLGEVLTDGVDALLVDDEPRALAAAFDRLAADEPLRRRLRERCAGDWSAMDARPVRRPTRGIVQ